MEWLYPNRKVMTMPQNDPIQNTWLPPINQQLPGIPAELQQNALLSGYWANRVEKGEKLIIAYSSLMSMLLNLRTQISAQAWDEIVTTLTHLAPAVDQINDIQWLFGLLMALQSNIPVPPYPLNPPPPPGGMMPPPGGQIPPPSNAV